MKKRNGDCQNFFTDEQKERIQEKLKIKSDKSTGCWIYNGYVGKSGYILINFDGFYVKAHRASYMAFKGIIPVDLHVCHTCDDRRCVNPNHLWLGTPKDNAKDRDDKERRANVIGSKNGYSKLCENQVLEIKKMLKNGKCLQEIALSFNVTKANIWCIKHGKSWTHINVNINT